MGVVAADTALEAPVAVLKHNSAGVVSMLADVGTIEWPWPWSYALEDLSPYD